MQTTSANVADLIDARPVGRLQWIVFLLCGGVIFVEGFDTQAIGYVGPALGKAFGLRPGELGPVFAAGLVGLTLGAFFLAPFADKIGRRPMILWSTLAFGLVTVATGFCTSVTALLWARLLTGIGLGAAMPNAIAMVSEYSPRRSRATIVTLLMCSLGLGSASGGLAAAQLLDWLDWPIVFFIGGAITLALVPPLLLLLPESVTFLAAGGSAQAKLLALMVRIDPALDAAAAPRFAASPPSGAMQRVGDLFAPGRVRATLLIWTIFFMGLLDLFLLANWLPTAIHTRGLSVGTAALATAMLQIGGIGASFILGPLVDRFGAFRVLPVAYVFGAICIVLVAYSGTSTALIFASVTGAGFAIVGCQNCNNAVASMLYPVETRATGVGWALAVGRIGSIVGPMVGGILLELQMPITNILVMSAVPPLVAALAYLGMRPVQAAATRLRLS